MKKIIICLLVTGALVSAGTISAFAAGGRTSTNSNYTNTAAGSVYDYTGSHSYSCNGHNYIDADHDGICDNCAGLHKNSCNNYCYTDADHNGICDNYSERICSHNGTGHHYGCRHGRN